MKTLSGSMNRTCSGQRYALIGATCALFIPHWSLAIAADADTESSAVVLNEVVVTARRVAETAMEVPLTITALSQQTLQNASANSLQDISFLTPGLTYDSNGAQADAQPVIRGLSDTSGGEATSSNVSTFLDGVYISNPSAIDLSIGGLERVEIVKGPVSGLYGRNAFTGAINYVTAKPTNDFSAAADVSFGDRGRQTYAANVSGPVVPDILKARVAVTYDRLDGTFKDAQSGEWGNGYDRKDALFKLALTPDEHISITPTYYYGDDRFTTPVSVTYAPNCALGTSNSYCGNLDHNQIGPFIAGSADSGAVGLERRVDLVSLDANFAYDFGTFDALYGYNRVTATSINSFDGTENGVSYGLYAPGANNPFAGDPVLGTALAKNFFGDQSSEHDHSIEIRYDTPRDYFLRLGLGGYHLSHDGTNNNTFGIDGSNVPAGRVLNFIAEPYLTSGGQSAGELNYSETIFKDKSGFVSGEWDIIPTLTLSSAVRYTDEFAQSNIGSALSGFQTSLSKDFYSTTTNSALTWKPNTQATVYVAAANGEKSGGFNGGAEGPADVAFNPETDVSFEAGTKLSLLDHRLQIDADVFHTTIANLQVLGPPSTAGAIGLVVKNFGDLRTSGFELEGRYDVSHGLVLGAGLGYSDPKFENGSLDFNDGAACALIPSCAATRLVTRNGQQAMNLQGLKPPFASDWTFNTDAQYDHQLGFANLTGFARVDYRYESKQYNTVTNFAFYGPRELVNLHIGVRRDAWVLTLFVLNATNDLTPITNQANGILNGFDPPPNGVLGVNWVPTSVLPEGRTYGVKVGFRY